MRSKIPLIEQALTGVVQDHHRQLLAMQLAHIDFLDEQIETLNRAIEVSLSALSAAAPSSEGQAPCPSRSQPSPPPAPLPRAPLHAPLNSWTPFLGLINAVRK